MEVILSLILFAIQPTFEKAIVFQYSEFNYIENVIYSKVEFVEFVEFTPIEFTPIEYTSANESSAKVKRLFYRCPRDRLAYAWIVL